MRVSAKIGAVAVATALMSVAGPAGVATAQVVAPTGSGTLGRWGSGANSTPSKKPLPGTITPPSPGQPPAPGGPPSPPPSFLRDIGGFMFRCGVGGGYGTGSCHLLPPPKPGKPGEPGGSTPGGTLGTFGPGGTPTEECATDWTVNYGGRTYPMSGAQCAGPVSTGWIEAVCNAAPTGGTVSFGLSEAGWVPHDFESDWHYVRPGPYTSSFTVPSCSPAAQENPTSITWQVKGPHYPSDTVNGQGIRVEWHLVPVVRQVGVDIPEAPDLGPTLLWDGFSSTPTVTNYAKDQILGPNTQALIGHPLPQWLIRHHGPATTVAASNTGQPAPVVTGRFYVRTFKHRPMTIRVTGSYTAVWGHWYFRVTATPSAGQGESSYVAGVIWHSRTVTKVVRGKEVTHTFTWTTPEWGVYYYPVSVEANPSVTGLQPKGAQEKTFPVSATIKVRTYRAVVTAGG
jgi:hypothetical protein